MTTHSTPISRSTQFAVIVAALGYFVDVFDLVLFSIARVPSLTSLGLSGSELLDAGIYLLNMQLIGLLLGGVLWGVMGDKRGRISVLFGSILTYSLANIANAFVQSVEMYAVLRLIAGIGLAGELGAGITLVSEMMPKEKRGWGTTIVASVGVTGAIAAALVGEILGWRAAYGLGGGMGLLLLALRIFVHESGMFQAVQSEEAVRRGDLLCLFRSWRRFSRYVACIFVGLPVWYFAGILMTFAPEIAQALGCPTKIVGAKAVLFSYIGLASGDFASGLMSQILQSRKKAIGYFIILSLCFCSLLLLTKQPTAEVFYLHLSLAGFAVGYWAVFVTTAAEQFGTNLRATVATTIPNFVRGAAVPMTLLFKQWGALLGIPGGAAVVGAVAIAFAIIGIVFLEETFHRDLEFVES